MHSAKQDEPENPQLLCALADVTRDAEHYEAAWRVSRGRCTRAQRSLAKRAMQQIDWSQVRNCFTVIGPQPSMPAVSCLCSLGTWPVIRGLLVCVGQMPYCLPG